MKTIIADTVLSLVILSISLSGYSQILHFTNSDTTFYQIINKVEAHYLDTSRILGSNESLSRDIEEDIYPRWEWFWRNRVDKYGGFAKYGENMLDLLKSTQTNNLKSSSSCEWTPAGPSSDPNQCSTYPRLTGVAKVTSVWANSSTPPVGS